MLKTSTLLSFLLIVFVAVGCGDSKKSEKTSDSDTLTASKEPSGDGGEMALSLDNGKKWQANPETTQGIKNMRALVSDYSSRDDLDTPKELQDSLAAQMKLIFQRCTMEGEAHNQLHHYLLPLQEKMGQIIQEDIEASEKAMDDLYAYLQEYDTYFE